MHMVYIYMQQKAAYVLLVLQVERADQLEAALEVLRQVQVVF